MRGVELGADHRPPRPLVIVAGSAVRCPLTSRRQPIARCRRCPHLQGTLDGPDPAILCSAAPSRPSPRRRLVFFQDWPEAD